MTGTTANKHIISNKAFRNTLLLTVLPGLKNNEIFKLGKSV